MGLLGFLFGTRTNIFNKKGRVQHDLGKKKWEAWDDRLKENPQYDWTHHKGRPEQEVKKGKSKHTFPQ